MIHWRNEGEHFKVGLNVMLARGHLSVCWVSYDFATHMGASNGFDISRRGIRRRKAQWNVIENYLRLRDVVVVHAETFQDMLAAQDFDVQYADARTYVNVAKLH